MRLDVWILPIHIPGFVDAKTVDLCDDKPNNASCMMTNPITQLQIIVLGFDSFMSDDDNVNHFDDSVINCVKKYLPE